MGRCKDSGRCTLGMGIVTRANLGVIYHGVRGGCFLEMGRCVQEDGRGESTWVKIDAVL